MLGKNNTMKTGLQLLGWAMLASTIPTAFAAMPVPVRQDAEASAHREQTLTSEVASITLPGGAQRPASAGDMADFNEAMQKVARDNHGTLTRSEVLLWTGDAAKTAVRDLNERLKAAGYVFAAVDPFDAEPGHVTPIAAGHGDKAEKVVGFWIETKDNQPLLVWGRFTPNTAEKAAAPIKVALTKTAAAPRKAAAPTRKIAVTTKKAAPSHKKARMESDAERQAKAYKAYQDYQYVKLMGPISGPMYRSTKW